MIVLDEWQKWGSTAAIVCWKSLHMDPAGNSSIEWTPRPLCSMIRRGNEKELLKKTLNLHLMQDDRGKQREGVDAGRSGQATRHMEAFSNRWRRFWNCSWCVMTWTRNKTHGSFLQLLKETLKRHLMQDVWTRKRAIRTSELSDTCTDCLCVNSTIVFLRGWRSPLCVTVLHLRLYWVHKIKSMIWDVDPLSLHLRHCNCGFRHLRSVLK